MLGWCMVLLAPLTLLPAAACAALGVVLILFQGSFARFAGVLPEGLRPYWEFVYPSGVEAAGGINVLYVLVPWIGVMALGYGFGALLLREPAARRRLCLLLGVGATLAFLAGGTYFALTASPSRPGAPPFLFRLLNQQKYPPSLLFLLMTLGPAVALMPLAEQMRGRLSSVLATFGRVPFFYYLLHIPTIHLAALAVVFLREGALHPEWYATAPFTRVPPDHRWGLPLLYLVWIVAVAALYFPCRWFAGLKARRGSPWLRYL
jgi:uncharacterized membrane protein